MNKTEIINRPNKDRWIVQQTRGIRWSAQRVMLLAIKLHDLVITLTDKAVGKLSENFKILV